jgi:hypothetical protein
MTMAKGPERHLLKKPLLLESFIWSSLLLLFITTGKKPREGRGEGCPPPKKKEIYKNKRNIPKVRGWRELGMC